jgi:hypothetical protein
VLVEGIGLGPVKLHLAVYLGDCRSEAQVHGAQAVSRQCLVVFVNKVVEGRRTLGDTVLRKSIQTGQFCPAGTSKGVPTALPGL